MFLFLTFCAVVIVSIGVWTGLNALVAWQCKAAEIVKGVCSGLVQAGVIFLATSAHPWLALMSLIMVAALVVFYVCWAFRISTYGVWRIAGISAIFAILLPTFWATIEAIRTAVGLATITGSVILLFGRIATIVVVGLIVARILSTFGRSGLVKVVVTIAAVLVAAAVLFTVYEGVSALDFHPFKGGKAAVSAVDEPEGNFILRWLKGLSGEEAEVSEDESSVAEVDDESAVAEVADESIVADIETEEKAETEREPIIVENAWFDFYNLSLQEDGVDENDFNFGPKPVDETVSGIAIEHRERLRVDPALGAADIAWADALLGTRYLGEFYESCKHDWAKTINAAKERFMNDHEAYDKVLDEFLKMQAKAKPLVEDGEVMEDQMYMNPFTIDGYPDVIVLKTPNHKGKFLVYEYTIKGTGVVRVAYRIDCGFQPTDVQKVMNITPATEAPEKKPDTPKPQTAGKITPAPTPTPKPTAAPTPTPVPGGGSDPAKDPSKAPKENTERNDDPGTGKATNSGNGSTKSAAASDSQKASDGGSVEDYDRKVEQNRSANAGGSSSGGSRGSGSGSSGGQKSGGESNKPSQSVSGKQDNNGNTGNGGSSIDKPTAKSETAVSADTNQSVDASGSAGGIIGTPD